MLRKTTLTIGLFFLCTSYAMAQGASEKIKVVATIFPNYDFTKQIGKDKVDVVKLLPPGVEAHGFEPRPKDVVTINKADVFVYTGKYMEPWAEDILDGVTNKELAVVDASKGIELMDEADHDGHGGHGGEHAFEWAGAFDLPAGKYTWTFAKVEGDYADPAMKMVFVSSADKGIEAIEAQEEAAEKLLEMEDATPRGHGEMLSPNGKSAYKLTFDQIR
jgi:ABC-type Zn uptake system ZnuABC Zn-binding protein ZnuA